MEDFDKLETRWKKVVDFLDKGREKPLRFLRYSIFARYNVDRLPAGQAREGHAGCFGASQTALQGSGGVRLEAVRELTILSSGFSFFSARRPGRACRGVAVFHKSQVATTREPLYRLCYRKAQERAATY